VRRDFVLTKCLPNSYSLLGLANGPIIIETFAQVLLRVISKGWLAPDQKGTWRTESGWQRNSSLVAKFSRDLLEPIVELRSCLEKSGVPDRETMKLLDFLDAASLCHPTVPVLSLLMGVSAEETDYF
jgi:hypothetical protein